MSNCAKGFLQLRWQPLLQFVRYRNRINIQKPKPPHFERALMEAVCKPILPIPKEKDPNVPLYEVCELATKKPIECPTPYLGLLKQHYLEWLRSYKYMAFFHIGTLKPDDEIDLLVDLKKLNLKGKIFKEDVVCKAILGTEFEALTSLFKGPTLIAFSNDTNASIMLKVLKKSPLAHLMGAVIDGQLLDLKGVEKCAKLKDLTTVRCMLLGVLNSAPQQIIQHLNYSQSTLVQRLQQHVDLQNNENKEKS